MKITNLISLVLLVFISGCSADPTMLQDFYDSPIPQTISTISKLKTFPDVAEASPIVWGGEVLVVDSGITIRNPSTSAIISNVPTNRNQMAFICAIVDGGRCYIYGTSGVNGVTDNAPSGNSVMMIQSSDLINWSAPVTVYQAPSTRTIFNTSVAPSLSGYIMVMEVRDPETPSGSFCERFAESTDLIHFNDVGGVLHPNTYSSCPTIRYVDGFYYVIHDERIDDWNGGWCWVALVSRSTDLISWHDEDLKRSGAVLSPIHGPNFERHDGTRANDNSDVDLVEFNGSIYFVYDFGDQATWGGEGLAKFDGTLSQFFNSFSYS